MNYKLHIPRAEAMLDKTLSKMQESHPHIVSILQSSKAREMVCLFVAAGLSHEYDDHQRCHNLMDETVNLAHDMFKAMRPILEMRYQISLAMKHHNLEASRFNEIIENYLEAGVALDKKLNQFQQDMTG